MREKDILTFLANLSPGEEYDDNSLIDRELIELCRDLIKKNVTTLKDIPFELGNTIANIFYKLCLLTNVDIKAASWFPKKEDYIDNTINFTKIYNRLERDLHSIPGFIEGLRNIDRVNDPELYNYTIDFIIDCLKYDIENIGFKSLEERIKEREIKNKYIREISNLIYLLDV